MAAGKTSQRNTNIRTQASCLANLYATDFSHGMCQVQCGILQFFRFQCLYVKSLLLHAAGSILSFHQGFAQSHIRSFQFKRLSVLFSFFHYM